VMNFQLQKRCHEEHEEHDEHDEHDEHENG